MFAIHKRYLYRIKQKALKIRWWWNRYNKQVRKGKLAIHFHNVKSWKDHLPLNFVKLHYPSKHIVSLECFCILYSILSILYNTISGKYFQSYQQYCKYCLERDPHSFKSRPLGPRISKETNLLLFQLNCEKLDMSVQCSVTTHIYISFFLSFNFLMLSLLSLS